MMQYNNLLDDSGFFRFIYLCAYYLFIAENNRYMTMDVWLGELLRHKIKGIQ